ncbi:replication factor C subunit 1-like [Stegodyphus dumicola]|uniref:replication factor C subunit 1-like n=1 Tax=Stegodyphus dumicola TaxID=202533 RepID=UPI0015AA966B|nr:replication factor C subunit 1-like [Stegodyphus dumicola]
MDIRKYLTSARASVNADSSEFRNSKKTAGLQDAKLSKSKKRRIVDSDSEEDPIPKSAKQESNSSKRSPRKVEQAKANEILKKIVSPSDFFGSNPVSRSEKKKILKEEKSVIKRIHEDDDFEETLSRLSPEKLPEVEKQVKKNESHNKEKVSPKKVSKSHSPLKVEKTSNSVKSHIEVQKQVGKRESPKLNKEKVQPKKSPKSHTSAKMELIANCVKPHIEKEPDEKPPVKKHKGNASYASYLAREGPRALGSKPIPEGEEDCLAGLTFIITGILESMEREEAQELIEKYGGKVMKTVSKNTKYIVIGRDAGASKLEKAEKFGTIQLDEDGLLDLIRTMPGKNGSAKSNKFKENKSPKAAKLNETSSESIKDDKINGMNLKESVSLHKEPVHKTSPKKVAEMKLKKEDSNLKKSTLDEFEEIPKPEQSSVKSEKSDDQGHSMWVDKYKPLALKQVIGQQGDKSNAKKLLHWLVNWTKSRRLGKKPIPGRFNAGDDGSAYKAALLSGPPGVGKTTTAQLVCKEAGYDYFELNASDTRSKKILQVAVSELLGNQTLADCFKADSIGKVTKKHVIIMDEVDGMAGNEDRGGMQELISFIKASKVPIICICNDRNHPKIRSLSNYCFDLRFQKPRVEQIKAAMMSIAFKEGIKVSSDALQDVIVAANQDIRQVLHNMSVWSAKSKGLSAEQTKSDIGRGIKHIKIGTFDVLREVFAIGNNPKATLMDKSDLFFHDYSIAPLFVQENYIHVVPKAAEGDPKKHLTLLSEAADSICIGDIIDKRIRTQNSWGLLPTQAIFASVVPGELLRGHLRQMINFPAWLGKNSNRNHMDRVLQELHVHMRMKITGNKTDVALEYLPLLKRALTRPLITDELEGVNEVLKIMENYYLLREDFDSIIDLSLWPNQTDPRTKISTKVKSAFTRAYNKEGGKNPYAVTNVKKKKRSARDLEGELEDDAYESEEEEDDSLENDAMIKIKKPTKKNATSEASTSKEKKNPKKKIKS